MGWTIYIVILMGLAALFFIGASFALHWAHHNKQLENLEEGARTIFDEDEPEGIVTDQILARSSRQPTTDSSASQKAAQQGSNT